MLAFSSSVQRSWVGWRRRRGAGPVAWRLNSGRSGRRRVLQRVPIQLRQVRDFLAVDADVTGAVDDMHGKRLPAFGAVADIGTKPRFKLRNIVLDCRIGIDQRRREIP